MSKVYDEFLVYDLENTGEKKKLDINQDELQNHLNPERSSHNNTRGFTTNLYLERIKISRKEKIHKLSSRSGITKKSSA